MVALGSYCLPKAYTSKFIQSLQDGTIDPNKLSEMSSKERNGFFKNLLGEENADQVNALFESKLLQKNQQRGMINWAKQLAGLKEPARRNLVDQIQRLERVLTPEDEHSFLADLAKQKLGGSVTPEEAHEIFQLSQKAAVAREELRQNIDNKDAQIKYGNSVLDLQDKVNDLVPKERGWGQLIIDALNIPRAMMSSFDLSAPGVQGMSMVADKRWSQGLGAMFKYFGSEEGYRELNASIIGHPYHDLSIKAKLSLSDLGTKLTKREEMIQSSLAEQASHWFSSKTGIPDFMRASNRAFTGYLNYLRFYKFVDMVNAAKLIGEDVRPGSEVTKSIARMVNNFTGRGNLGFIDKYGNASPFLNTLFFAPRKFAATIERLNPTNYINPKYIPFGEHLQPLIKPYESQIARQQALKNLVGEVVILGSILGLAKGVGADVSFDPRDQNFLTIGLGDTKFDITGGDRTFIRLMTRLVTGESISSRGKLTELDSDNFNSPTRGDEVLKFFRGKLAPLASAFADWFTGSDAVGQPFSIKSEVSDKFMPMFIKDFVTFLGSDDANTVAIIPALFGVFGVNIQSPLAPPDTMGLNVWGEPSSSEYYTSFEKELVKAGYAMSFPIRTINGVKLTDKQYKDYIMMAGHTAKMQLQPIVQSEQWNALPKAAQLSLIKQVIRQSRTQAASVIQAQSYGTSNDILTQSMEKKLQDEGVEYKIGSGANPNSSYPTSKDYQDALKNNDFYGSEWENIVVTGKSLDGTDMSGSLSDVAEQLTKLKLTPNKESGEIVGRALIASRKSAISALGFDPTKFAIDHSGGNFNLAGFYSPSKDIGWVSDTDPSSLLHESTHRGLELLKKSGTLDKQETDFVNKYDEYIVRHLMDSKFNDPETGPEDLYGDGNEQVRVSRDLFKADSDRQKLLDSIEHKAAILIAKRRPGGSR